MEIRPKKDIEELLAEGIETIESIKWKEQGESEVLVSFKTDKAPLRDLLEIYGRLSKMGFAECGIEDRGSNGPVIRFVPVK
jgi:hypothetical protein